MEEITEPSGQEQTKKSDETKIEIGNYPVMQSALDVLEALGKNKKIFLLRSPWSFHLLKKSQ